MTIESVDPLCALRNSIARIEGRKPGGTRTVMALGSESPDRALGGGLAWGRLHELFATQAADATSAAGFAAALARMLLSPASPLLWLRLEEAEQAGPLSPEGLAQIGLDPGRLILLVPPDPVALLRAAADAMRCRAVGAVVIELWGAAPALDLTASRRLAMAANDSGVTALLLRINAAPAPSAAHTRWQVCAAPSTALVASAPGAPAFDLALLRQRGRPEGGRWRLEWDRERARFAEQALPRSVVSAAAGGSAAAGQRA